MWMSVSPSGRQHLYWYQWNGSGYDGDRADGGDTPMSVFPCPARGGTEKGQE